MKAKNIILGMFLGVVALTSCESWFDVSPKTDMKADELFQDEAGFRDVLTGVYALMTTENTYGKQLSFGYTDVLARYYDNQRLEKETHDYFKTYQYLYKEPKDREVIDNIWFTQYKAISNLNTLLECIDDNKNVFNTEAMWHIYKGEALGLRAFLHFDVLRLFGASPKTGMNVKAIPYMEKLTNVAPPRLTVKEVLDKVICDLNKARELMREYDSYGPRYAELQDDYAKDKQLRNRVYHMNYYAATALLARVYLYAGDTGNALKTAQEIIGESGSQPKAPFELAKSDDKSDPLFKDEIIFCLEMPQLENIVDPYFGTDAADLGMLTSDKVLACSVTGCNGLFKQQSPSDNDYRKSLWFAETSIEKFIIPNKFQKTGFMPLLKLSELYYIAAECAGGEQGLAYLNQLRGHRGLAFLPAETNDLQQEIYKEYCKEFFNEGQMFYYYKRFNLSKIGVLDEIDINPEDVYILPLPIDEMDYGNNN